MSDHTACTQVKKEDLEGENTTAFGAVVKNSPASVGDARDVGSIPGQEDPLQEGMATHSSILAWRIPWTEEADRLQSMGLQSTGHDLATEHR